VWGFLASLKCSDFLVNDIEDVTLFDWLRRRRRGFPFNLF